ncbi:MAG: hypothetical protein EOO08_10690 [Chitinophagaceae bacterium]|nr:MAG: hypothetical protein EOO08_10690 [Chitinophagaceae bacterium]
MLRRSFVRNLSLLSTGLLGGVLQPAWSRNLHKALRAGEGRSAADLAEDDDFWYYIEQAFTKGFFSTATVCIAPW